MANPQTERFPSCGEYLCPTEADTRRAAMEIAASLGANSILSLEGPMGAGKTCFVKGLAEAISCDPREVSSPTFTLVHEYQGGRVPLVHMDLYRLESESELAALGFEDHLAGGGIVAIEWGGKFAEFLPPVTLRLVFSIEGQSRRIQIQP
ncbi:MAG: tRNA (adenosine(37)-N6)-threonylcarbamoyltransferase complex ATPase subunit type 1 TsaE [bacterium]